MVKVRLQKIRLNQGGYDSSGRYWGTGAPVYRYEFETKDNLEVDYIRAADREAAKQLVTTRLKLNFVDMKFSFYGDKG